MAHGTEWDPIALPSRHIGETTMSPPLLDSGPTPSRATPVRSSISGTSAVRYNRGRSGKAHKPTGCEAWWSRFADRKTQRGNRWLSGWKQRNTVTPRSATGLGRMASACTVAFVIATLAFGNSAQAACISQTIGTTTIHNCDGKISTSHTVGSTTVHNIDGKTGVSQTIGSTTVHSFNGKRGTSQTVGKTTIHNIHGKFGLSQTIGDITIHSGPLFTAPLEAAGAPTLTRHTHRGMSTGN